MPGQTIGTFRLANKDALTCQIRAAYVDRTGRWVFSPDNAWTIPAKLSRDMTMADLGVPNGSLVQFSIAVGAGDERRVNETFVADYQSLHIAQYIVDRRAQIARARFEGILTSS